MLLTPPSAYRAALRLEERVAERRKGGEAFAAQLRRDKERALGDRKQKLVAERVEREEAIARMRDIFGMGPPASGESSSSSSSAPAPSAVARIETAMPPGGEVGSQTVPTAAKCEQKTTQAGVNGDAAKQRLGGAAAAPSLGALSTAAPSTAPSVAGDDFGREHDDFDDILSTARGAVEVASTAAASCRGSFSHEAHRGCGGKDSRDIANEDHTRAGRRGSRSKQQVLEASVAATTSLQRQPSEARVHATAPVVPGPAPAPSAPSAPARPVRLTAPMGLKALRAEEEALQKSLLRLDFVEMQRQFAGQPPLWNDGKEAELRGEESLMLSIERLSRLLEQAEARKAIREEQEATAAASVAANAAGAPSAACHDGSAAEGACRSTIFASICGLRPRRCCRSHCRVIAVGPPPQSRHRPASAIAIPGAAARRASSARPPRSSSRNGGRCGSAVDTSGAPAASGSAPRAAAGRGRGGGSCSRASGAARANSARPSSAALPCSRSTTAAARGSRGSGGNDHATAARCAGACSGVGVAA
eukprot:TRINITY_DN8491_c0_g1_i2.p1 TRINITY_DN8491_c0_g1~~TRINITY_DN8491_c0_g1_i2.p1  ORF type:complete len:533 (-),score=127.67 TRINITY_DN8491_c0_g1_i2:118-1716(-)